MQIIEYENKYLEDGNFRFRRDINKLDGIVEWFDELLHCHQDITHISESRINKLCILLNRQINKIKEIIKYK